MYNLRPRQARGNARLKSLCLAQRLDGIPMGPHVAGEACEALEETIVRISYDAMQRLMSLPQPFALLRRQGLLLVDELDDAGEEQVEPARGMDVGRACVCAYGSS